MAAKLYWQTVIQTRVPLKGCQGDIIRALGRTGLLGWELDEKQLGRLEMVALALGQADAFAPIADAIRNGATVKIEAHN